MAEPTKDDVDALVGPATPHFAYQLRARVRQLIADLAEDHPVRRYGEEQIDLLDRLGAALAQLVRNRLRSLVVAEEADRDALCALVGEAERDLAADPP